MERVGYEICRPVVRARAVRGHVDHCFVGGVAYIFTAVGYSRGLSWRPSQMSDLSDERLAEIISEMEVGLFEPLFREVLFMARELQARRAPPTAGDVERMLEGFKAIHRWLSPSDRTFDELIRAVGIADDIARAAIAATLSAAPSGDMWQPIKTAPTDGTEVLVY